MQKSAIVFMFPLMLNAVSPASVANSAAVMVANSSTPQIQTTTVSTQIAREEVEKSKDLDKANRLDAYFQANNMPLAGYGLAFVQAADKYGIDWRLLPAIGVIESTGGKFMANNNPFGWGNGDIKFTNVLDAIDQISSNLGGFNPATARLYRDASTIKKLHYYNPADVYATKVMAVMRAF